jgi:predicted RNA binding protein YcfA (HicA-like mRNA interferase family)
MKYSELRRILEDAGCWIKRNGSNHDIYYSPISENSFPVGRHTSKEIPTGTVNKILKQAGLK